MPIFNPTTIEGTPNQVLANGNSLSQEFGNIVLSLPQDINATASPTFNALTLSNLTSNSFSYVGPGSQLVSTTPPVNGQILIGSSGNAPVLNNLTAGTGISIVNSPGSISISNSNNAPGSGNMGRIFSTPILALSGTTQFSAIVPPTVTSGWQVAALPSITPNSVSTKYLIDVTGWADASSNNRDCSMAVFRDNILVAYSAVTVTTSGRPQIIRCYAIDSPATTSPITYTVRFGMNNTGTSYINQSVSATITNTGNTVFTAIEVY